MWNYLFRNYILKDWVVFLEVYSQPLRLGKYGPGATEQDKRALLSAVANIGADAAAIIPESMMIEFCESKQSQAHADSYLKAIEYLDKRLTIAVLGQELTTQLPRGAGSRAAAEVHDAVRRDIAADDAPAEYDDLARPVAPANRPQSRPARALSQSRNRLRRGAGPCAARAGARRFRRSRPARLAKADTRHRRSRPTRSGRRDSASRREIIGRQQSASRCRKRARVRAASTKSLTSIHAAHVRL